MSTGCCSIVDLDLGFLGLDCFDLDGFDLESFDLDSGTDFYGFYFSLGSYSMLLLSHPLVQCRQRFRFGG